METFGEGRKEATSTFLPFENVPTISFSYPNSGKPWGKIMRAG
jgi:hypothetical protein